MCAILGQVVGFSGHPISPSRFSHASGRLHGVKNESWLACSVTLEHYGILFSIV